MALNLVRYWFEFDLTEQAQGRVPWVGVTAWTLDDARLIISEGVFGGQDLPQVTVLIENVDVSTLDGGHVLPNMGAPNERGIWYPKGY